MAGNYNETAIVARGPGADADHRPGARRQLLQARTPQRFRSQRAGWKVGLTANWTLDRVWRDVPRDLLGPAARHDHAQQWRRRSFPSTRPASASPTGSSVQRHRSAPVRVRCQQPLQHPPRCSALCPEWRVDLLCHGLERKQPGQRRRNPGRQRQRGRQLFRLRLESEWRLLLRPHHVQLLSMMDNWPLTGYQPAYLRHWR